MSKYILTQECLKKQLNYNPITGTFTWIVDKNKVKCGQVAGYVCNNGYNIIMLDKKNYRGARLAFLYMTGRLPEFVDHIDLNKRNDAWINLRESTHSQNMCNVRVRKNNKTGFKGVYKRNNSYLAACSFNKKRTHLGYFPTAELAAEAYKEFAKKVHGDFYNPL